jgi:hypothetical protein
MWGGRRGQVGYAVAFVVLGLVKAPLAARAQEAQVPDAKSVRASELLDEATRLFSEDADYDGALMRFQYSYLEKPSWEALNGVALVYQQQGKYVDAIESYEQLLGEFGAALDDGQRLRVRRRMAELEKRIGAVVVSVAQVGTSVAVDGRAIGDARRVRLLAGHHTLVASLAAHETMARLIDIQPGVELAVAIELRPLEALVAPPRFARRFPRSVPWTVMGGGLGLAALGGLLHFQGREDVRDFDAQVRAGRKGVPVAADPDLRTMGESKQVLGVSLYVAGGAAMVTGVVLMLLNQPRLVEARVGTPRLSLARNTVGVAIDF